MIKLIYKSILGIMAFVILIFLFNQTARAANICGDYLTIDVFDYEWWVGPGNYPWGACQDVLVYFPTGSHDESCSPTNGDCKTDRAVCADVSPRRCTPGGYNTSPCTSLDNDWCASAIEEAQCEAGTRYFCQDSDSTYIGSASCTPQRYDCWINWDPTSTPPGGGGTATPIPTPSCTLSFSPSPVNVTIGDTANVTANVVPSNGTVDRVDFAIANPAIATINPNTDNIFPYRTVVRGVTPGNTELRATAYMGGVATCGYGTPVDPAADPVNVTNPNPWWRVFNGDVITNASLRSLIPSTCSSPGCNPAFSLTPLGGQPGLPSYVGGFDFSAGIGTGTVSSDGWIAQASYDAQNPYNYAFFERQVPGDTVRNVIADVNNPTTPNYLKNQGTDSPDGYKWYFREGDLTIARPGPLFRTKLNKRKVVLFVSGNLTINEYIQLDTGEGFFMAIAGGNITVNSISAPASDPDIEGIYVTDANFISTADPEQLSVRGMVAAYGQVILGRDLADDSQTPAETFEYAPDQLLLMPFSLNLKRTRWKEVAP